MSVNLVYLPRRPEFPVDNSTHHKFGSPEYDKARQEFARDLRHYRNSLRSYTKQCLAFAEARENGSD